MRVLVTGASSGIGEAFARHHALAGNDVILSGRSVEALERITRELEGCPGRVSCVAADLSTSTGVDHLIETVGDIDVLVASAGVTAASSIGTFDTPALEGMVYLMTTGVVRLCEALVPGMARRGDGQVIIVSSIGALVPMRKSGAYAASKAFATSYACSLSLEVRAYGVRVVALCPGYVRTDLHRRAGLGHLSQKIPRWMWLEAPDMVTAASKALRRGKVVVVPGLVYRAVLPFLSSSAVQFAWRRLASRSRNAPGGG